VLIDPRLELGVVDVFETITIKDLDCIKAVRCTVAAAAAAAAAAAVPPPPTKAELARRAANRKARTKNKTPMGDGWDVGLQLDESRSASTTDPCYVSVTYCTSDFVWGVHLVGQTDTSIGTTTAPQLAARAEPQLTFLMK
jgi:hypothetical protein